MTSGARARRSGSADRWSGSRSRRKTLDDATELALDRLGVVARRAGVRGASTSRRGGLFGIGRTEARIRARVKPLSREKPTDRRRRRRRASAGRAVGAQAARRAGPASRGGEGRAASRPPSRRVGPTTGRAGAGAVGPRSASTSRTGAGAGAGAGAAAGAAGASTSNERPASAGPGDRPEAKMNVERRAGSSTSRRRPSDAAEFTDGAWSRPWASTARVDARGRRRRRSCVAIDGDGPRPPRRPAGRDPAGARGARARGGAARPERPQRPPPRRRRRLPRAPPRGAGRLRPPGRRRGARRASSSGRSSR